MNTSFWYFVQNVAAARERYKIPGIRTFLRDSRWVADYQSLQVSKRKCLSTFKSGVYYIVYNMFYVL